ncbi:MAG TPA: NAD(P)-binding domain-containing protein [Polyangiaceae bacterium]|nr:NAD(P)-binding domain-containing protein [Polyangiaceae bacterium]HMR76813.1 NAD(P)-binding domain-containing protein [Polyangiaceae bacterium]
MSSTLILGGLIAIAVLLWLLWEWRDSVKEKAVRAEAADVAGMGEVVPTSLHPVIDPNMCMGSGACVAICPEHGPLGLIGNRAVLVNPLGCVGHGACEAACPVSAIRLVFGTKTRGVELPEVGPTFETNQPGVYIVGELGGMGLIRNAVSQGAQAVQHIAKGSDTGVRRGVGSALDLLVVGAGPAGISATLGGMQAKLRTLLVEREALGGTITHYPRAKVVMTGPLDFPLFGRVKKKTMSKEALISLWRQIMAQCQLPLATGHVVERITRQQNDMWLVESSTQKWEAANVVLALGMRGSPRKLGVPGEELEKVAYRLLEPDPFAGKHVLIVGGGNSAVESALSLADFGRCASVAISYRRDAFARCRGDNRRRIEEAIQGGRVRALMPSNLSAIEPNRVLLKGADGSVEALQNDAVIAQIGGTAPADLLKTFGINLVTKYGER